MKKTSVWIAAVLIALFAAGCASKETAQPEPETPELSVGTETTEEENLEKLCKVWGYAKYTHPVFLKGEKNWDEELLSIMDSVQEAKTAEEANELLHQWFVSLGEVETTSRKISIVNGDVQADLSWTKDTTYLGEELTADFELLHNAKKVTDRSKAPVQFTPYSDFSNEPVYDSFDYSDENYRLLGLFRLWNAMEYYYPYHSILDEDWDDVLKEAIPEMLEVADKDRYRMVLMKASAKLQDTHVQFNRTDSTELMKRLWGDRYVPVKLSAVGEQMVVGSVVNENCPLKPGDVILSIDGKSMEEIIADRMTYVSVTDENKVLARLCNYILATFKDEVEVVIENENGQESHLVKTIDKSSGYHNYQTTKKSHEILDGNIGLIHPKNVAKEGYDVHDMSTYNIMNIMEEMKETDGLIIDLRQYPSEYMTISLPAYFTYGYQQFATISWPSDVVPGTFTMEPTVNGQISGYTDFAYYYDKPVVLLMNETTWSNPEYTVMALRNGDNVTVMGENSIGSDGNVMRLPLPCGVDMTYTSIGIYTPDGGQTQRCGLTPDIYVEDTVEGIREGRDELMEAAIAFIQNQ